MSKTTSKARHKRASQKQLRRALRQTDGVLHLGRSIIRANYGDGVNRHSFTEPNSRSRLSAD